MRDSHILGIIEDPKYQNYLRKKHLLNRIKGEDKTYLLPFNNPSFDINSGDYLLILEKTGKDRGVYTDTFDNLGLYNGSHKVEALIGFDILKNELRVRQLQARLGAKSLPKRWERILLESAINFSIEEGLKRVSVMKAERIKWYNSPYFNSKKRPDFSIEEHRRNLKRRYNSTPKRRGFKLDDVNEMWVLEL